MQTRVWILVIFTVRRQQSAPECIKASEISSGLRAKLLGARRSSLKIDKSEHLCEGRRKIVETYEPRPMKSFFAILLIPLAAAPTCSERSDPDSNTNSAAKASTVSVVPRAEWSQSEPDETVLKKLPMGKIRYVSIHQTETPFPDTVNEMRRLRGIQGWHQTNPEGPQWGDIAYHYLIGPGGEVYEGRSEKFASASGTIYLTPKQWEAAPQNAEGQTEAKPPEGVEKPGASAGHLTISVIGTFHETLPSEEVRAKLVTFVAQKLRENGLGIGDVFFHREIACYTDCPGQALYDWFRGPERKRGSKGEGLKQVEAAL